MRIVLWIIKLALFALVFSFAVKNTDPVTVRYYLGTEWQAPLILILLIAFCAGAAVGIMTALGRVYRQRREIGGLKKELRSRPIQQAETLPPAGKG